jgi:hypothetical protein
MTADAPLTMYYVTWDDAGEGRVRTQYPRQAQSAIDCRLGLEKHGAEHVQVVPCREDENTLPTWKAGDPGSYYFARGELRI